VVLGDVLRKRIDLRAIMEGKGMAENEQFIENLKCCGNCGNKSSCWNHWKCGVCDSWIYDGEIKEDRENE